MVRSVEFLEFGAQLHEFFAFDLGQRGQPGLFGEAEEMQAGGVERFWEKQYSRCSLLLAKRHHIGIERRISKDKIERADEPGVCAVETEAGQRISDLLVYGGCHQGEYAWPTLVFNTAVCRSWESGSEFSFTGVRSMAVRPSDRPTGSFCRSQIQLMAGVTRT
jgi:hypothetical protein